MRPAARGSRRILVSLLLLLSGCDGCGDDDGSGGQPPIPTGLAITNVTSGRLTLSWIDASGDERGFIIERSLDGVTWTFLANVGKNVTSYVDRGLLPLTTYWYRVSARGNGGSLPSAPASAATLNLVWQAGTVAGGPTARVEHAAIYDAANKRMIVFGGDDGIYDALLDTSAKNDTWELDLKTTPPTWNQLFPTGMIPPPLVYHSAVYDAANKRMIVFGGITSDSVGSTLLNGLWSLSLPDDGSTPAWSSLAPPGGPGPRFNHVAVYDEVNRRMIVCGGTDGGGALDETWALALPVGGAPGWSALPAAPTASEGAGAIYDATGRRMILYGGRTGGGLQDSFYSLSLPAGGGLPAWSTLLSAPPSPPAPRADYAAVYDAANVRMIVFGGENAGVVMNDVGILPLLGVPVFSPSTPTGFVPPTRMSHSAIYDPAGERMIIFSGDNGSLEPIDDVAWPLGF
jgi:hypothetical protein